MGPFFARSFESAAAPLGIGPTIGQIHGLADIERAVAAAADQPNSGIFVPPDVTISAFVEQTRVFVKNGGLVYYGADRVELYRGAASYVDRILRGERVADLPYQQPTKYELVINLKTAKALSLTVPQALRPVPTR